MAGFTDADGLADPPRRQSLDKGGVGLAVIDRRSVLLGGLALAACGKGGSAGGGSNAPVRIILPVSVGSTGDTVARRLVGGLSKAVGRSMYVDNLPGAGGIIGTQQLEKADPDGNTLGVVTTNHVVNAGIYKSLPYDTIKDFTPIAIIGYSPQVLVVNAAIPAKNLSELVALAKAKPGTLHFGSSGNGTTLHLLGAKLAKDAGIDITHVPYKGAAPFLTDLIGGQVQMGFQSTTQLATYIKAGKLRAIGVTSKARSKLLPDVPTLAEQGLGDFDLSNFMAVLGPPKLPADLTDRFNKGVNDTLKQPDVANWFADEDWTLTPMAPAEAKDYLAKQEAKYIALVRNAGVKQQ